MIARFEGDPFELKLGKKTPFSEMPEGLRQHWEVTAHHMRAQNFPAEATVTEQGVGDERLFMMVGAYFDEIEITVWDAAGDQVISAKPAPHIGFDVTLFED